MSSEFLKIRWQWNSYRNSSRILIRILVENAAVADRGISGNSSGILIRIPADY